MEINLCNLYNNLTILSILYHRLIVCRVFVNAMGCMCMISPQSPQLTIMQWGVCVW